MQRMVVEEQEASTGKEAEENDDKGNEREVGVDAGRIDTVEGEAPIVDEDEGETPEFDDVKGKTPVADDVEGETPVFGENIEGETPVFADAEGETRRKVVEGETPDELVEGETPVYGNLEGETPVGTEGRNPDAGRSPIATEVEEPESFGLKEIVDLVEEPENEDTPLRRREARRMARWSRLLDKEDEPTQPRRLEFNAPGAGVGAEEDAPRSEDELEEAERRCLAAERKRNGKQAAQAPPKRSRKTPSAEQTEELLPEATKVPFAKGLEGPSTDSEAEDDEEEEQTEELNYERTEVWVTKKLPPGPSSVTRQPG